jgi:hypothetical protein
MIINRTRLKIGTNWKYVESGVIYTVVGYAIGAGKNQGTEFILYQDSGNHRITYSRDTREWVDTLSAEATEIPE